VERNPVAADLVGSAHEWIWSSCCARLGQAPVPAWLDGDGLHGHLIGRPVASAADRRKAVAIYAQMLARTSDAGLWQQGLRQQVFLGDESFVERTLARHLAVPGAVARSDDNTLGRGAAEGLRHPYDTAGPAVEYSRPRHKPKAYSPVCLGAVGAPLLSEELSFGDACRPRCYPSSEISCTSPELERERNQVMTISRYWRWVGAAALLATGVASGAELRVSGSDTLESFFQNALSQYGRAAGAEFKVTQAYKGTTAGFRDLCEGRADITPASASIDADSARRCQSSGIELVELPLAFDAVVIVANPARAGAGELSLNELKTIFHPDSAGKVQRWGQVRMGLPEAPLNVVSLDPRSGTVAFMTQRLHGLRSYIRTDAKATTQHSEVLRQVAADPGAIGYVSLAAVTESRAAVWRVPVNFGSGPVVPSRETVLNDAYAPFSRLLYLYANKKALAAKDSPAREFTRWLLERGAKLAAYEGFVPLVERNYQDGLRKIGVVSP
jgi:phosphate transport system substrate-binding protein